MKQTITLDVDQPITVERWTDTGSNTEHITVEFENEWDVGFTVDVNTAKAIASAILSLINNEPDTGNHS
jgi:hypothetical protein